jgi:hypothetical protein
MTRWGVEVFIFEKWEATLFGVVWVNVDMLRVLEGDRPEVAKPGLVVTKEASNNRAAELRRVAGFERNANEA